ncbi:MAG: CrcB family protein [Acidimicrobiia bacterium]
MAGGLLGSGLRVAVVDLLPTTPGRFPTTTLAVNLAGSLLVGFYLARRQRAVIAEWSLRFWAIGVLGSFTTFSMFSVEVFGLLDMDATVVAVGYVGASLLGGVAAALVGRRLGTVGW